MACNFSTNCNDNDPPLNIDQLVDGVDQYTCMANTILASLSASCNGISIDYTNFLACYGNSINTTPLAPQTYQMFEMMAECKKQQDATFDKESWKNKAIQAYKLVNWLILNQGRLLFIPVKCDNDTQQYNPGTQCQPVSNDCVARITYRLNYSSGNQSLATLNKQLCSSGSNPVITALDMANFPPGFSTWYKNTLQGANGSDPVYILDSFPNPPKPPNLCARLTSGKHATLLIGVQCVEIGGKKYLEYTFKDSYSNSYGQVKWKIRLPFATNRTPPWTTGITLPNGTKITSANIVGCSDVNKKKKSCCTPTPTGTPAASPTRTPAVSPTRTPAVSPTRTPAVSPTRTPAVSPTRTPPAPTPTPSSGCSSGLGLNSNFDSIP